jgi:putative nucleotidyltransferase-like protein
MTDETCWESAAAALGGRRALHELSAHELEVFLRWALRNRLAGLLWRVAGPVSSAVEGRVDSRAARDGWLDAACRQAAYAVYQEQELRRVVEEFVRAGISPIFLKGAALAYTLYPDAALRPGADHDMLIRPDEAVRVRAIFERLGYEPELQPPGEHIASQFGFRRTDARAMLYLFDIHLKISNVLVYADRLTYDEIRADAVSMPRLDSHALAPSPVHSLFIACVHRIAHHADTDDLLWLYDIHLLAGSLTESERERALTLAQAKQLSAVLLRGIERAGRAVGQSAPEVMIERLRDLASREPPPPLVGSGTRMIDVVLTDFRTLQTTRARLQLFAQHLMPPASYMRRLYPRCPARLLPLAYAYRIARGAPRWFRRK